MSYGNPDHLRRLAIARVVLALTAASEEDTKGVWSILCADDQASDLAGVTTRQRQRIIDVLQGGDVKAAADEIGMIIIANHGDSLVPEVAASIDILETLRGIEKLTDGLDQKVMYIDPRKMDIAHPHTAAARKAVDKLLKIRSTVKAATAFLAPPAPAKPAWGAAE